MIVEPRCESSQSVDHALFVNGTSCSTVFFIDLPRESFAEGMAKIGVGGSICVVVGVEEDKR
jgi:hypothetical protein